MKRRAFLAAAALPLVRAHAVEYAVVTPRPLVFPRDHGAHPEYRTEWWYLTGWLDAAQPLGFQITFFRTRTGIDPANPSRFAARQLIIAHAAIADPARASLLKDERIARAAFDVAAASETDTDVRLDRWRFHRRADGAYECSLPARAFTLEFTAQPTQPLLLQGDAGFSRKGPEERQASHYTSEPQLAATLRLALDGRPAGAPAMGHGWIDHEWSDEILHPEAVGWDWIGINLFDGGALTAFVLRRRDGSPLWAGGSFRAPGQPARIFAADEVRFQPGRRWRSPQTAASYPVQWQVSTPAGRWQVQALMDEQELDSRGSTGTVYWEGLSELLDGAGRRVGLGYLEMTGYAGALRL